VAEFRLEAIAVLVLLLPGFLAARLEQRLAVSREQSDFDKIVEALLYSFMTYLVFTAFTRTLPVVVKAEQTGTVTSYRVEANLLRLALLAVIAVLLAVAMSFATNADLFGRFFRLVRISRRSWRDTIWSDVFHNFGGVVQVELSDGRSVMGWLKYFSDRPSDASFFLERAAWVDGNQNLIPIDGPGIFLTGDSGIRSVSFLNWNAENGRALVTAENESFVRWQSATITQLGYAVNLFLGFAGASLGFALLFVKDQAFRPGFWSKLAIDSSIALLEGSLLLGVWCAITRLRDFRMTAAIARDRSDIQQNEEQIGRRVTERRAESEKLGRWTWGLFYSQILAFACGVFLLIVTFAIAYCSKLF
jgi:hypothetical protein